MDWHKGGIAPDVGVEDCAAWCAVRGRFEYILVALCLKCLSLDLHLYEKIGISGSKDFQSLYFMKDRYSRNYRLNWQKKWRNSEALIKAPRLLLCHSYSHESCGKLKPSFAFDDAVIFYSWDNFGWAGLLSASAEPHLVSGAVTPWSLGVQATAGDPLQIKDASARTRSQGVWEQRHLWRAYSWNLPSAVVGSREMWVGCQTASLWRARLGAVKPAVCAEAGRSQGRRKTNLLRLNSFILSQCNIQYTQLSTLQGAL